MKRPISCVTLCAVLGACSFIPHMPGARHEPATPRAPTFDTEREAILVFGLPNAKARVQLEAGDVKNDFYRADWTTLTPIFYGGADHGFVLVKVPADRPVAITSISMQSSWRQFWSGGPFQTCRGQKVAVFQVPRGKVLYYSDFDFRPEGNALMFTAVNNFAGAQSYLSANFPQLAGRLEAANFVSLTRGDDCQKIRPHDRPDVAPTTTTAER